MEMRIIKKYPNRRLYDTKLNTYITLDDVKKLVLEHEDFQIIDTRTKKDLTQNTLLQIISEQEATSTPIFTTSVLQDFIRFYHEKSQTILSQYLEQALDLFIHQKEFFQNQWVSYQQLFSNPAFVQQVIKMQKNNATYDPDQEKKVKKFAKETKAKLPLHTKKRKREAKTGKA